MFGQEAGGEELWLCYICLKNNQAVFVEDEQDYQLVIDTNVEEDQDETPDELINEITNQNVVQAHHYVKAMKKLQNYNFENSENSSSNSTAAVVHSSIFDRDDFQLNLSRKPEDQV